MSQADPTRAAWTNSLMPAVIVPATIGSGLMAEARRTLEAATCTRYSRIDRGSYEYIENPPLPELVDALSGIAEAVTGRRSVVADARALRLSPGDYLLTRHDRVYDDRPLELVLDLSAATVAGADVHWRHRGQVFFMMPSAPGSLAIVERGPTVMSNHLYVSRRQKASVVRLIMLLR